MEDTRARGTATPGRGRAFDRGSAARVVTAIGRGYNAGRFRGPPSGPEAGIHLPKPNRPLVRDGRLQAPKKRTDRSYLRPGPSVADEELPEDVDAAQAPEAADDVAMPESAAESAAPQAAAPEPASPQAAAAPIARPAVAARAATTVAPGKLPTAVRAIQQQGVRKRRDVDLHALAVRDTNYAIHEIRRIAILTVLVIISLTVLTIILR